MNIVYPGAKLEPVPYFSSGWPSKAIGILDHFTAGCGDPHGAFLSRKVSAHACVMRDGSVIQYVGFENRAWHAYDCNDHYYGIEHQALPGVCDLTDVQLEASAKLSAWLCKLSGIPVVRSKGGPITPGFKAHNDGLAAGAAWDPNGHWDGIWKNDNPLWVKAPLSTSLNRSSLTWSAYAAKVNAAMGGDDDVTQEEVTNAVKAALNGILTETGEFANAVHFVNGQKLRRNGDARPVGTTQAIQAKQAGWDSENGSPLPPVTP